MIDFTVQGVVPINFMIAFGLASIVMCIGMFIRARVTFIGQMLIPASVIGGVIGLLIINTGVITSINESMYIEIVNILFTITFISIGLTSNKKNKNNNTAKQVAKGSLGLGFIWNILYALTPAVAVLVIIAISGIFDMNPLYGLLIPFAFAQGPGQAATFGTIIEQEYGLANAATVGMTFAAIGFLICFLVGVPLVKYGIKKGLANHLHKNEIDTFVQKGYYSEKDNNSSIGKETVYSGNMDTMTFHFAIIGVCFMMALGMAHLVSYIPNIGSTFGGMLFMYGMLAGYLIKFLMKKLKIEHFIDNTFQTKITGWSTDYLIVASFMSVSFQIIGSMIMPILIVAIVITIISLIISIYFAQRLGGMNDFERTAGLFGSVTGTVPSGIALIRILDPGLKTTTAVELGLMNVPMTASFGTVLTILAITSEAISLQFGLLLLLVPIPIYLIILKLFKVWGKKTYNLNPKPVSNIELQNIASEK